MRPYPAFCPMPPSGSRPASPRTRREASWPALWPSPRPSSSPSRDPDSAAHASGDCGERQRPCYWWGLRCSSPPGRVPRSRDSWSLSSPDLCPSTSAPCGWWSGRWWRRALSPSRFPTSRASSCRGSCTMSRSRPSYWPGRISGPRRSRASSTIPSRVSGRERSTRCYRCAIHTVWSAWATRSRRPTTSCSIPPSPWASWARSESCAHSRAGSGGECAARGLPPSRGCRPRSRAPSPLPS